MESTDGGNFPSVEVQYTKDDFAAAYQLGFSLKRSGWLFCALFIPMSWIAIFFFLRHDKAPLWFQVLLPTCAVLGGVLAGLAHWALFSPWFGRRTYARQPLARLPTRIELRPEGVRFQSPRGESTILWRDFTKWRANSKTTLLYISPSLFLNMPARLTALGFPMDDLKAILRRELGAPVR